MKLNLTKTVISILKNSNEKMTAKMLALKVKELRPTECEEKKR